jgi:hypothetical protein
MLELGIERNKRLSEWEMRKINRKATWQAELNKLEAK